jgi:drug/metabolite transporter (DMT)-like permease
MMQNNNSSKNCITNYAVGGFSENLNFSFRHSSLYQGMGGIFILSNRRILLMELWKYSMLVFLGGCSYGVVSTFVKLAYRNGFTAAEVTGSQYFFGAAMLWLVAIFVPQIKLTAKQWAMLLISGVPMGLTGIFYNQCLAYSNASFAIILLLQFIWMNLGLQYFVDNNIPNRKNVIAIIVIFWGSALASDVFKSAITLSWPGIAWGLLAALSFATFIYVSGRTSIPIHPIYKSVIMTSGAAIVVFVLMPPVLLFKGVLTNGLIEYGMLTGLFGSVIPPVLFNIGMPKVRSLGNILSASELPMAVFMSTLVLRETVNASQWVGVLLILVGIVYPNLEKNR